MSALFATFGVAGLNLGVDVLCVQEVLHDLDVTPVPLSDPSVLGLLNLRGQILTAVDARSRLGLPPAGAAAGAGRADRVMVILRTAGEAVGLVVDSAGEVTDVDADDYTDIPDAVSAAIRAMVTGAYKLDHGLLLALDVDRALSETAS